MRTHLVAASIIAASASASAANCDLPKLADRPEAHPECLFYTGTTHFRAKDYAKAKASWLRLKQAEDVPVDLEYLRTSALNNLGFLYYMGWGTEQDRSKAIESWNSAFAKGHEEAAYHLCHTYGEPEEAEFDAKRATAFCREALRRYDQLKEQDEDTERVVSRVRWYLGRLQAR